MGAGDDVDDREAKARHGPVRAASPRLKGSNARARRAPAGSPALRRGRGARRFLLPRAGHRQRSAPAHGAARCRRGCRRPAPPQPVDVKHEPVLAGGVDDATHIGGGRPEALCDGLDELGRRDRLPAHRQLAALGRASTSRSSASRSAARSPRRPTARRRAAPPRCGYGGARARAPRAAWRAAYAARGWRRRRSGARARAPLQSRQHLIERLPQPAQLVVGRRQRQPLAGLGGRDRLRLAPHRLHRPQRRAGEEVAADRREDQRERADHEQLGEQAVERVVAILERGGRPRPRSRRRVERIALRPRRVTMNVRSRARSSTLSRGSPAARRRPEQPAVDACVTPSSAGAERRRRLDLGGPSSSVSSRPSVNERSRRT